MTETFYVNRTNPAASRLFSNSPGQSLSLLTMNYGITRILFSLIILFYAAASTAQEISEGFIEDELSRTQADPDSEVTLTINAPREFVFEFLTRRVHEYVADAHGIEFDHSNSVEAKQLAQGSTRTITMDNGEALLQRFLRFDPPNSYAYFVDMDRSTIEAPLDYSISRYELSEIDSDTTQLRTAAVYRSSTRLLAYFVRRGFNNALQNEFSRAAQMIESEYLASQ